MSLTRKRNKACRSSLAVAAACLGALLSAATVSPAAQDTSAYDTIEQMVADGNYARAEDLLTDRLVTNDKDVVALTMLGDLYRIKGSRQKAIDTLVKASKMDPGYPEPYFVLAKLYLSMQRFDEADSWFALFQKTIQPLVGTDQSLKEYYLRCLHYISSEYLLLKRYADFRKNVDEILRISPNDQEAYYNLGIYHYEYRHDRSAAYQSFSKALAIDRTSPVGMKARYAIEFIRANPDSRVVPDYSFINQEFKN